MKKLPGKTEVNMWKRIADFTPIAYQLGFGELWEQMIDKRTPITCMALKNLAESLWWTTESLFVREELDAYERGEYVQWMTSLKAREMASLRYNREPIETENGPEIVPTCATNANINGAKGAKIRIEECETHATDLIGTAIRQFEQTTLGF
jgi:hypothetical protein